MWKNGWMEISYKGKKKEEHEQTRITMVTQRDMTDKR